MPEINVWPPTESQVNADEILAQTAEPSSIDRYIASERRESEKKIRQFHLTTLERFRRDVQSDLEMRRRWVIQAEAQVDILDKVIAELKGGF